MKEPLGAQRSNGNFLESRLDGVYFHGGDLRSGTPSTQKWRMSYDSLYADSDGAIFFTPGLGSRSSRDMIHVSQSSHRTP